MNKIRFHIIIPTREGAETLKWTIKSCLDQDYNNYNIWVSDNCSEDDTYNIVKSFNDPRIHYIKTPERLSMSDNWEFALNHITDGYVMFLGDDDAMVPNTLHYIAEIITKTNTELITWRVHKYNWPSHLVNELKNILTLFLDYNYLTKQAHVQLKRASKELNYNLLPGIYYGFVDIKLINRIKNKTQRFFNAQTPDLYSAIVLASELKNYIHSFYGFSIAGHSYKSNGNSFAFPQKADKNKCAQMFINETNLPIHPKLEFSFSSTILCADAFLWAHFKIPQIPLIDIKDLINFALIESNHVHSREKQIEIISIIEKIATKNNLLGYFKHKKSKIISNSDTFQGMSLPKIGFNEEENALILNCKDLNIDNIYSTSLLIRSLLKNPPVNRKFNPLKVSKSKYFLRGIYESLFALKNKIANLL